MSTPYEGPPPVFESVPMTANPRSSGQWPGWPPTQTGWTPGPEAFGGRPFIILNPSMHIINLSTRTKSSLVKFAEYFKSFTEKWFSHILLLMFLFAYAAFGAWLMMMVEGGVEQQTKAPVVNMKDRIKRELWFYTHKQKISQAQLNRIIDVRLHEFEEQLVANFKMGIATDSNETVWTFWASFVYCFTVFTTIGYGHIAPITTLGRAVSMAYAFFGIPFLLMVLADLGKLFTRAIKLLFKYSRKVFYAKRLTNVRKAGRRATLGPQGWGAGGKKNKVSKSDQDLLDNKANEDLDNDVEAALPEPMLIRAPTTPFIYPGAHCPQTAAIMPPGGGPPIIISGTSPQPGSRPETPGGDSYKKPSAYEVDDEFNIPVSLALLILALYMMLGAVIFSYTDDWSLFDSFYFVYISMSTIGFGDLTPVSELSLIAASIYLLFGLALTSMCINVIQEKLVDVFEETKIRLAMRMGLESQMMAEEEQKRREEAEATKKKEDAEKDKEKKKKAGEKAKAKDIKKKEKKKVKEREAKTKDDKKSKNSLAPDNGQLVVPKESRPKVAFTLNSDGIGKGLKDRRMNVDRPLRASASPVRSSTASTQGSESSDEELNKELNMLRKSPSVEPLVEQDSSSDEVANGNDFPDADDDDDYAKIDEENEPHDKESDQSNEGDEKKTEKANERLKASGDNVPQDKDNAITFITL